MYDNIVGIYLKSLKTAIGEKPPPKPPPKPPTPPPPPPAPSVPLREAPGRKAEPPKPIP